MTPQEILLKKKINYLPKGKDLLVRCLNPEHEDKNPSMRIDTITGIFHCWSCGFKGNIFNHFGQKANQLQIRRHKVKEKIAEKLAENIGLEIPINAIPFQEEWRGISGETFKKFEAFQHNDPNFIGRVVIPIRSAANKIVAFVGRHMTKNENPRYLIYPVKANLPLFPVFPEAIEGRIILVEGIFDMLNLWDKGLTNVMCTFGTSTILGQTSKGPERLKLLKIRGVFGVDILFDADEAGQKAAIQIRDKLENELEFDVRNYKLKAGTDPGDLTAPEVMRLKERLYG